MAARTSRNNRWTSARLEAVVGKAATEAGKAALKQGAEYMLEECKKRCPYDPDHDRKHQQKGVHLRDSLRIEYKDKGMYAKILTDLKTDNGYNLGAIVEYSSRVNVPFMQQTKDACMEQVQAMIRDAIVTELKNTKKG
ncbi:hypothetical protein [Mitsuokella multacida]|uniref:hypothetical protein n=1 Tax=Mitsuokella multacida TaxID=52226 RepID=UPI00241D3FDD|nr:hypothetical protein [Mitsuokella multacida]